LTEQKKNGSESKENLRFSTPLNQYKPPPSLICLKTFLKNFLKNLFYATNCKKFCYLKFQQKLVPCTEASRDTLDNVNMMAQVFYKPDTMGFHCCYCWFFFGHLGRKPLQNPILLSQHQAVMPAEGLGPAQQTTTAGLGALQI
jgi:hypothetical protein